MNTNNLNKQTSPQKRLVLKLHFENENQIRKIPISTSFSFENLKQLLSEISGEKLEQGDLKGSTENIRVYYTDEEGDEIRIGSSFEWEDAMISYLKDEKRKILHLRVITSNQNEGNLTSEGSHQKPNKENEQLPKNHNSTGNQEGFSSGCPFNEFGRNGSNERGCFKDMFQNVLSNPEMIQNLMHQYSPLINGFMSNMHKQHQQQHQQQQQSHVPSSDQFANLVNTYGPLVSQLFNNLQHNGEQTEHKDQKPNEKEIEEKLKVLHQMGFHNEELNTDLLKKFNGDIQKVINQLFSYQ